MKEIENKFYTVTDVTDLLGISESTAYKIIHQLNDELKKQGKIIIAGKISKKYFNEKTYL